MIVETGQILNIFNALSNDKIFTQKCLDISNINKDIIANEYIDSQFMITHDLF